MNNGKNFFSIALGIGQQHEDDFYHADNEQGKSSSGKSLHFSVNLFAEQFLFGPQAWKKMQPYRLIYPKGAVTVNQFNIELPGDSKLALYFWHYFAGAHR